MDWEKILANNVKDKGLISKNIQWKKDSLFAKQCQEKLNSHVKINEFRAHSQTVQNVLKT